MLIVWIASFLDNCNLSYNQGKIQMIQLCLWWLFDWWQFALFSLLLRHRPAGDCSLCLAANNWYQTHTIGTSPPQQSIFIPTRKYSSETPQYSNDRTEIEFHTWICTVFRTLSFSVPFHDCVAARNHAWWVTFNGSI